jgi:DNA-binding NtrC family response regulator
MNENMKILIVDDEPVVCKGCERTLVEEGYEVRTSLNGKDGIELLQDEEFDIVITDLKMPGISGMQILVHIKENYPDIQVIIITGYSTIENAIESIKKGAFDYISKPFTPEELVSVVREASMKRIQTIEKIYQIDNSSYKCGFDNIIGNSDNMLRIYDLIQKLAQSDSTVLITGESGTGKELIARAVYNHSLRKDKQFIAVDCNTLTPNILDSGFFGNKKGSFTGAVPDKRGIFEIADKGTLFLDEISNISIETQSKLLRVLEQNEFRQVGSEEIKKVDIRLIAATKRNLRSMILYYSTSASKSS